MRKHSAIYKPGLLVLFSTVLTVTILPGMAQQLTGPIDTATILRKFAANAFASDSAARSYSFSRDVQINTIGMGGQ